MNGGTSSSHGMIMVNDLPTKSQRIEVWRHEVAQRAAAAADHLHQQQQQQKEPQKKDQNQKHQGVAAAVAASSSSFLFARLLKPGKTSSISRGSAEISGRDDGEGEKEEEQEGFFESTTMYGVASLDPGRAEDGDEDGEQSMAIAGVSVSSSSERGPGRGLVAKQERLERAARLLRRMGEKEGKG